MFGCGFFGLCANCKRDPESSSKAPSRSRLEQAEKTTIPEARKRSQDSHPQKTGHGETLAAAAFLTDECVRQTSGAVFCWRRWHRYVASATPPKDGIPTRAPKLEGAAQLLEAAVFSYIVRNDGSVFTWGIASNNDRLNRVVYKDASIPTRFESLSNVARLGYLLSNHVFALRREGDLVSWTERYTQNEDGEYTNFERKHPQPVPTLPKTFALHENCAVSTGRGVYCISYDADRPKPVWIPDIANPISITACKARGIEACAIDRNGTAQCFQWSDTAEPRLREMPDLPPSRRIWCDSDQVYFVARDGSVRRWDVKLNPANDRVVKASHLKDVKDLRGRCVLYKDGRVACWGSIGSGQLGSGNWSDGAFDAIPEVLQIGLDLSSPKNTGTSDPKKVLR